MLAWKLGAVTGIFFFFKQLQIFEERGYRKCVKVFKKRRKVCISIACVAGVTIL